MFGPTLLATFFLFFFFTFLTFLFIFEREKDRAQQGRGREREREREREDTESQAGSKLRAVSTEPGAGLELTDCEIMTWAKAGHSLD